MRTIAAYVSASQVHVGQEVIFKQAAIGMPVGGPTWWAGNSICHSSAEYVQSRRLKVPYQESATQRAPCAVLMGSSDVTLFDWASDR